MSVLSIVILAGLLVAVLVTVAVSLVLWRLGWPSETDVRNAARRSSRTILGMCAVAALVPIGFVATAGLVSLPPQRQLRLPSVDLAMLSVFVIFGLVLLLFVSLIAALIEIVQRERRAAGRPELSRGFLSKWSMMALIPIVICVMAAIAPTTEVVHVSTSNAPIMTAASQQAPMKVTRNFMFALSPIGILILAMAAYAVFHFVQTRKHPAADGDISRTDQGTNGRWKMAWGAAAGLVVMAVVFGSVMSFRNVEMRQVMREAEMRQVMRKAELQRAVETHRIGHVVEHSAQTQGILRPARENEAVSALDAMNEHLPQGDRTVVDKNAPAWLSDEPSESGATRTLVISSQQFATIDEATADAKQQLVELLINDLSKFEPDRFAPRRPEVNWQEIGDTAIRDSYLQTVQRDFGSFFAPMYRVWYRVELSPRVRESYLWTGQELVRQAHTRLVLAGFAGLLLIPLGIVVSGSLTRFSGPNSRSLWNSIIGGATVGTWIVMAQILNRFVVLW